MENLIKEVTVKTIKNLIEEIEVMKSKEDENLFNDFRSILLLLGDKIKDDYKYKVKYISSPQSYNDDDYLSNEIEFELTDTEELDYYFDDYVYNDMKNNWKDYDLKDKEDIYTTEIVIEVVKK